MRVDAGVRAEGDESAGTDGHVSRGLDAPRAEEEGEHEGGVPRHARSRRAAARSAPEGEEREARAGRATKRESLGPELRRAVPDGGVPVHRVGRHGHHGPGRHLSSAGFDAPVMYSARAASFFSGDDASALSVC